jgi:hypothetical protein
LHFEVLWKVSCLHPIWRHLHAYTPLAKVFGYFGLKLHKSDSYRTFRSVWCCEMIYTDRCYGMRYRISCIIYCYRFDHKTKTAKWVSLKFFVEEDDILVDLLTKFQPDSVWNLREIIKTPVRYEMCCKFFVLHS